MSLPSSAGDGAEPGTVSEFTVLEPNGDSGVPPGRYGGSLDVEEDLMESTGLVALVDEALERFASRDLVAASEVVDFLLDFRSAVVADADLEALLESERQPTG